MQDKYILNIDKWFEHCDVSHVQNGSNRAFFRCPTWAHDTGNAACVIMSFPYLKEKYISIIDL